jgi:hypothetical protein
MKRPPKISPCQALYLAGLPADCSERASSFIPATTVFALRRLGLVTVRHLGPLSYVARVIAKPAPPVPPPAVKAKKEPFRCSCGCMVTPRSKTYEDGFCWRCARWDSRGGGYRDRYKYRVKGLLMGKNADGSQNRG